MEKTWVRYVEKPALKEPVAIAGAQGLRSVGKIAIEHLIKELKPRLFANLYCVNFCVAYQGPSYLGYPGIAGVEVRQGIVELPRVKFYWHEKPALIITAGYQAEHYGQHEVARKTVELYQEFGVKRIISLGSQILEKGVRCLGGGKKIIDEMEKYRIKKTKVERFLGFSGLILDIGNAKGIETLGLLGETVEASDPESPDPHAAKQVLDKLGDILGMHIDTSTLKRVEKPKEELTYFG
jgi:proteasome assembly chaperone (PAC2) family protein